MVYIFGLAVVFLCVVVWWTACAAINAIRNWHRRRSPSLPPPVTQPSLGETAEAVFARFMASTMSEDPLNPTPPVPPPARRRSSVYSGVVRAHPDCGSDPELPHYCAFPVCMVLTAAASPTASRPELIIIEDEDMPPPLTPLRTPARTPRSGSPVPSSGHSTHSTHSGHSGHAGSTHSASSSTGLLSFVPALVPEPAPGYTTRPATPLQIRGAPADDEPEVPGREGEAPEMRSVARPLILAAPYTTSTVAAAGRPAAHVTFSTPPTASNPAPTTATAPAPPAETTPARPPTARRKFGRRGRGPADIAFVSPMF